MTIQSAYYNAHTDRYETITAVTNDDGTTTVSLENGMEQTFTYHDDAMSFFKDAQNVHYWR